MNRRLILIMCCCIITTSIYAQSGDLMVQGVSPDMHLKHTVAAKENWYSIGRIYNVSPKEIAPYNKLTMDKPLSIGQLLNIPLTSANYTLTGSKTDDEVFVPLYHILQDKEWMYRVATNYNVPVEALEKWNGITKDEVKPGMKMIVGYLKVKTELSALASKGSTSIKTVKATATIQQPPVEVKKVEPVVVRQEPSKQPEVNVTPQETKPVPPVSVASSPSGNKDTNGGYFAMQYESSGKNNTGNAGIFKSTSGWQDRKYYALMNNVSVGVIIKITNPSSNKTVYAKVLGNLADMKENSGLTIRLSDAAATELGVENTPKFPIEVAY